MATTEFTATEDPVDNQTLLDAYNAQPKAGISYEVTPEFKAELQAARTHQDWLNTPVEPTDYSTLSGKQNRTIRDSINFIVGEDLDLYSKPAVTKKDYYERGFLDQEGKVTPKGVLAGDLVEKGILNKDFTITDNGKFFSKEESEFFTQGNDEVTDYNSYFEADPSRYDKMLEWKKAKDLGLFNQDEDEEDKPFVDTVSDTAVGVWDFLGLAGKTFQSGMRLTGLVPSSSPIGVSEDDKEKEIKRLKQEDQTRMYGFAEGAVENAGYSYLKINALAQKGLNYLQEKAGVLTKEQTEAYNTFNDYQAASLKNFQNKTKTVTNLLEAAGVDAAADLLAESRKVFGEERSEAIQQEGEQPGAMAGDFANVLMGPALKVVGATTSGGSKLLNSVVNSKRIKQVERIKDGLAKASLYETQANKLTLEAKLFSDEAANAALLEREAIAFGDTQRAILHTADKSKYAEDAAVAAQQAGNNANMARSLRETANVLENSLPPTFQSQVAKASMVAAAVPLKAAGAVVDKFGSTLAVVDRGISAITGTFGLDKARGLARAAGLFTGYINPLTIAEGVVASHKLWTGAGRLLNSLGENMLVNQGTNPFFRRVAADMATPVGRIFATSADTFIPPVVKGVSSIAKGVKTAAAPSLIYQAINQQGLDANVFKQAAADALVFGAPLGFGAAIIGKHSDFKSARQADRADFNNKMKADPAQYEIYNSMVDPLTKDVISSFVAAYPETQIKFVTEGPSFQQGNTATLNVNSPRDIIPVIALHELKHTLANQFQLNDLIKQKMVGDKTRPGDIFTKDGVLDPEFIAFGKEYNRRMKAGGMEELGIEDMAIEFYTDKAAEVLKSDIISGEFTGRAKESQLSRSIKAHFSTLVNQVPIIKNIHLKTGGAIDKSGKLVTGSGLVSGGLTQSPVVQAMVRKMYRETAGLTRQTKVSDGATISNTRIPQTKSNREGINNGTSAVENVNKQSREAGVEIPAGALDPSTPRGRDGVPTPLQTKAIVDSGAIHPEHLATFPTLVAEMVPDSSATFMFEYRPATQGRTAQSQAGETFHHVKPAGVRVNKKGNVLIIGLDINLWDKNIKKVANSKAAKDIGYSERDIRTDAYEASKFHIKNQSPDPYFEGKYGRDQALKRKSLVASTYGEMTKSQNNFNPLLSESGMSKADGVYRTFSLDDIKRVSRTNSTADLAFDPNNYYSLKINLMPEAPIVDRSGNIVENPVMKDFFENHLPNGQRFRTSENKNFSTPPSESAAQNALSSSKQPFFGKHRELPEGTSVGVRIDIPAFLNKGEYVQTVHKKGTPGNVGERIGYDTHVRLKDGVKFFVKEGSATEKAGAMAIKEGRANKHPIATVEGKISNDRSIPQDINEWTPVGMDPKKSSYFYDKVTNEPVVGGSESYSVGNTVFVKDPVYAPKEQFRYMPEAVPINEKFLSLTKEGKKFFDDKPNETIPGSILGTVRFMPENKRIMENFPVDDAVKTKMEGKVGFAFVSDWADSNRPYVTRNGRDIDVLTGGVGYTYHPEVIGKGGWAGSFSPLTNRVLKKINQTDGIGLVVAGGRESTASSRSFSLAFMEELRDDLMNKTISKPALDNIIKNSAEQILGRKDIKSFSDYNKILKIENNYGGLTFEQRADMIKRIGSDSNKKAFGILNWNDVIKKYEMQNGEFQSGQIMSVVQFKKDAPLARASEIGIKEHKSYEAVIQGKPLGMLTEKVMIADFFKDFFDFEGTQPASYTRKVQTKMPNFKYGEGSAVFPKSSVESISKVAKMK